MEKVLINNFNKATFVCPKCENRRTVNVSKYKYIDKAVKVKCNCPCGHTYSVLLERRKDFRKELRLSGSFTGINVDKGFITITDLSRSGLKFKLNVEKNIQSGDKLTLTFNLDDPQRSMVSKEVVVRSVNGLFVGAEFCTTEHYDKLGPYLLYNLD